MTEKTSLEKMDELMKKLKKDKKSFLEDFKNKILSKKPQHVKLNNHSLVLLHMYSDESKIYVPVNLDQLVNDLIQLYLGENRRPNLWWEKNV